MKKRLICMLICIAPLAVIPIIAQNTPETAGSIQNGRLILHIDLSWNEQQKIRLSGLFLLDCDIANRFEISSFVPNTRAAQYLMRSFCI